MRNWLLIFLFALLTQPLLAVIIQSSNRVDYAIGRTLGVQGSTAARTIIFTNFWSTNTVAEINSGIASCPSNEVVLCHNDGTYNFSTGLTMDKSGVTLRGEIVGGTNTYFFFSGSAGLTVGHGVMSEDVQRVYTITNGAYKGSTNLSLLNIQNGFGDTIKAGDALLLAGVTRNIGSDAFPVISTANYDRIIKQLVIVYSRSGNVISITDPLSWSHTNSSLENAMMFETDTLSQPRRMNSLEHLTLTLTNSGSVGTPTFMIEASCLRDFWTTNVIVEWAKNYQFHITYSANVEIQHCWIRNAYSSGTSHAGLIGANTHGLLVSDTIFSSDTALGFQLFPAVEINDGVTEWAFIGCYFTNNGTDLHIHNTHPMMILAEQCKFLSFVEPDGYFGGMSHLWLHRCYVQNTVPLKRWTSYFQDTGSVHGNTNFAYVWQREESGYNSEPYPIFEMGYPNIGNSGYNNTSPPVAWNFPGTNLTPFVAPFDELPNGVWRATNTTPIHTNVIYAWMGTNKPGTVGFTNIPAPISAGYALGLQDISNTNFYYGATNKDVLVSTAAGTSSNLVLNGYIWITNGSTLYMLGQNSYQQLQQSNKSTHTIHGVLVYTNAGWSLVWNPGIADTNIPLSHVYADKPDWWGTNSWPAIASTNLALAVQAIPAENRFNGIAFSTGGSITNAVSSTGVVVSTGRVQLTQ